MRHIRAASLGFAMTRSVASRTMIGNAVALGQSERMFSKRGLCRVLLEVAPRIHDIWL
jgi:hypothetical protein